MPAFNAVGTDAIGTTGASPPATFSASLSSTSASANSLLTVITLSAVLACSATTVSSLNSTSARLYSNVASSSTMTGNLNSSINLQSASTAQSVISAIISALQVTPMFTPSLARTINVQATSPVFTGGKWWTLSDPKKPRGLKDPDATIDITFDWSAWLNDISADPNNPVTISDVTFTVNGVSSVGSFSNGTQVTVFVSGGTPGSAGTVACLITTLTTPSRTDERTIYLDIAEE